MKKIFFGIFFAFSIVFYALSIEYINGHHYITFKRPAIKRPQIVEFFSFYCNFCYKFERIYSVSDAIKRNLPKDIKILKYHVDFLGSPMGKFLTKAWSLARIMGLEKKVESALFKGIQVTNVIKDEERLKKILVKTIELDSKKYDKAWNSVLVRDLSIQQEELTSEIALRTVPNILINNKYMINTDNIIIDSMEDFMQEYVTLLKYLLKRN